MIFFIVFDVWMHCDSQLTYYVKHYSGLHGSSSGSSSSSSIIVFLVVSSKLSKLGMSNIVYFVK